VFPCLSRSARLIDRPPRILLRAFCYRPPPTFLLARCVRPAPRDAAYASPRSTLHSTPHSTPRSLKVPQLFVACRGCSRFDGITSQ
jgi:hypothetical protein